MEVYSPLTQLDNVILKEKIDARDIIYLYRQEHGVDVSPYFKQSPFVYVYECKDTFYKFYYPFTLAGDGKFYEELHNRYKDNYYHAWKQENQVAFDLIQKDEKVLDVGCGVGNFLKRAKEKTNNVTGLELNEDACNKCKADGLLVYNELVEEHAAKKPNYYDVVTTFQVLEHICNVKSFLESCIKLLRKGGKLVLATPNNEPYYMGYELYSPLNMPPHHMGLWNKNSYKQLEKIFPIRMVSINYGAKGRILVEAYYHAKYLSGIKKIRKDHGIKEKLMIGLWAVYTLPVAIIKKLARGINSNYITVVFEKQ